jgi:hypothetical protein
MSLAVRSGGVLCCGFSHRAFSLACCAEVVAVKLFVVKRDSSVVQFNLRLILAVLLDEPPVAFRRVNHTFLYLYPRDT